MVEYRLGEAAWATYSAPVTLPEGVTQVQVRATDAAGNVSTVQTLEAKVDATAPTVWGWLTSAGRVAAVGTDPAGSAVGGAAPTGSGIARLQYSLDGSTWVDGLSALIATSAAPERVAVRAVDVAGNVGATLVLSRSDAPSTFEVVPGAALLIEASGFRAGQSVRIELHSVPVVLGTVLADGRGVISAAVTVPADVPGGAHDLVLVADDGSGTGAPGDGSGGSGSGGSGTGGTGSGSGDLTVPATVLASTGFPVWGWALGGGLLAALGALLLLGYRRRSA